MGLYTYAPTKAVKTSHVLQRVSGNHEVAEQSSVDP